MKLIVYLVRLIEWMAREATKLSFWIIGAAIKGLIGGLKSSPQSYRTPKVSPPPKPKQDALEGRRENVAAVPKARLPTDDGQLYLINSQTLTKLPRSQALLDRLEEVREIKARESQPTQQLVLEEAEPEQSPEEEMVDPRYFAPVQTGPKAITYQEDLDKLVGMAGPKAEVLRLANFASMVEKRREQKLPDLQNSFHMVFTGNPGTGKTTFARIIAKVLHQHNILPREGIVEVDRSGLVGQYVGHSEAAVKKKLEEALGRVLFIDEFYALASSDGGNDFGKQVIDVLVKFMEDHRDKICVIVAGYTEPMQKAISANPGLKSRFTRTIHFPDYEAEELVEIFDNMLKEKHYTLADDAYPVAGKVITSHHAARSVDFGNARDMRTLFERVVDVQANRVMNDNSELTVITANDVSEAASLAGMN